MNNSAISELNEEVTRSQNYDVVSINLKQLDSMLELITGEGFESFNQMNDEAKGWYLFNIYNLSSEAVKAIKVMEASHA